MPLLVVMLGVALPVGAQAPPPPPPPEAAAPAPPRPADAHGHDRGHVHGIHPEPGGEGALPADAARATPAQVFNIAFMRRALLAGLLVGGACAYLGVYVVLRRIVFMGAALAEISTAGMALALLVGVAPLAGSVGMMLAGIGLILLSGGGRAVRQDAFLGVGYAAASALSILLLAKSAHGEEHLLNLLFGNVLLVTENDVRALALALGGVLLAHALFGKEMLFAAFDPETAAASGFRARAWEALLYVTVGIALAFSIHAVGVLLTFAAMVLPPVTALLVTRRLGSAFAASVALGLLPVPVGLYLSFVWDLPSAATVVAASAALLLAGGLIARLRA